MLWIYLDSELTPSLRRRYFRDYLEFYRYTVKDWDSETGHVSLYVESNSYPWSYYAVGDIIYFFSEEEWNHSDIKHRGYRVDSDQVISWKTDLTLYKYIDKTSYLAWCQHKPTYVSEAIKSGSARKQKNWLYMYDKHNLRYDMYELVRYFKRMGGQLSIPLQSHIIVRRDGVRFKIFCSYVIKPVDCFALNDYIYFILPEDVAQVTLQLDQMGETFAFAPDTVIKNRIKDYYAIKQVAEEIASEMHVDAPIGVYHAACPDVTAQTYSINDCMNTWNLLQYQKEYLGLMDKFEIKDVIFNEPATIVLWADGTKTVVKCQNGEKFDKEKGLALCYMKKMFGNKSNFNNTFKKWIKSEPTASYDEKHPELGIQDTPPKNKKEFPSNILRIKTSNLSIIHTYMQEMCLTTQYIAKASGLSTKTVKRALTGCPVLRTSILKICGYFDFPIETTRYVED